MSEQKKNQTFLEVKNLKVEYFSDGQIVHAVMVFHCRLSVEKHWDW